MLRHIALLPVRTSLVRSWRSVRVACCGARVGFCDGFRMPARTNIAARTRAGVRKPPGKEGARCGAAGSAGAMGIWLAPSVQRRRYAAGRAAGEEHRHPSPAQTGIKSALMQGVARRLPYPRRVIGPNAVVAGWEPAA